MAYVDVVKRASASASAGAGANASGWSSAPTSSAHGTVASHKRRGAALACVARTRTHASLANFFFALDLTALFAPAPLASPAILVDAEMDMDPISVGWLDIGDLSVYRIPSLMTTGLATPPLDPAIRSNSRVVARRPSSRMPSTGWAWPLAESDDNTGGAYPAKNAAATATFSNAFSAAATACTDLTLAPAFEDGDVADLEHFAPNHDTEVPALAADRDGSATSTDDDDDEDEYEDEEQEKNGYAHYANNAPAVTDDEYDDDSSASESLAPTMEASESGVALQDVSSAGSPGPYLSGDDDDTGIDTQYAGVYHDNRKAPFVYRVCLGPAANIITAASAVEPYYYDDDATSNNFVYDAPVAGISIKQEDGAAAAMDQQPALVMNDKRRTARDGRTTSSKKTKRAQSAANKPPRAPGSRRRILTKEEMEARIERARVRQLKNRMAAKKCRERKQDHHKVLIVEVQRMRQENARLRMQAATAAADLAALRAKLQQ